MFRAQLAQASGTIYTLCWSPESDSMLFSDGKHLVIRPLQPYTLGAVVWDQGERDTHCFSAPGTLLTHTKRYPCLERQLMADRHELWARAAQ